LGATTALSALVGSYLDRFGNTVILTRAQWEDHIVAEHLDMASLLWSLSRVLRHPRQVNQDTSLEARRCFYRDALVPRKLVKVVVEYPLTIRMCHSSLLS